MADESFDEDELEEYLRKKDQEALKKQGRSVPASKSAVSFAAGGAKKGSIEETRAQIQQKAAAIEAQHQGAKKNSIPPVAKSTAQNWAQQKPAEPEPKAEAKGLADARKLPEAQTAGGGGGKAAPAPARGGPAPARGGPAPVRGNSRVPFMDEFEREEDLMQMPGCKDEVGLKSPSHSDLA